MTIPDVKAPPATSAFHDAVAELRAGADATELARGIYELLTHEERLSLLDGDSPVETGLPELMNGGFTARSFVHGRVERLGIPGLAFSDGPRGCVIGPATAFPVPFARGATFDVELEERVGDLIGREVRAVGANLYGGVCINLPRHPAWGRSQETYGDEPLHLGDMGAALTRGVQRHAMATVKHYALNSMENARFTVDVQCDESSLHDVYLPHFKRVVDEDIAAVMSAYNSVNGSFCGENPTLLTDILREQWGFSGITVSDWIMGFKDGPASLAAGLDVEMPFRQRRAAELPGSLAASASNWDDVERAGVRIIATQLRSYASRSEGPYVVSSLANDHAQALAREVAARSMVLLQNEPVDGSPLLPLQSEGLRRIAVIGRLATAANLGDQGSSDVKHTPITTSPVDGLRAALPGVEILLCEADDPPRAADLAAQADLAIVIAGYTAHDEGEYIPFDASSQTGEQTVSDGLGGDRRSLRLRPVDEQIITAVAAANPKSVVAVVAGGAVVMQPWRHSVPALLMMWYAGAQGGNALADVLLGTAEPSGRLPMAIPRSEGDLMPFDAGAASVTYERHTGQRYLDANGHDADFPYGYGLSYGQVTLTAATSNVVERAGGITQVTLTNTCERDSRQVVQIYGNRTSGTNTGEIWLLGFKPVLVPAHQTVKVDLHYSLQPLAQWDPGTRRRLLPEPDAIRVEVSMHRHDPRAISVLG